MGLELASVIISVLLLLATAIYNWIYYKRYRDSLSPILSFKLFQYAGFLYLAITNSGQSSARNVRVDIKELYNNGDNNQLELDDLFKNEFDLFPKETVQGRIAFSGENLSQTIFPYIITEVSYNKGNDNKAENYCRIITFTRTNEEVNKLENLENSLKSISYSNNRIANYMEGKTLYVFDEINSLPNSSLFKDMKDAFNNIEREEKNINNE